MISTISRLKLMSPFSALAHSRTLSTKALTYSKLGDFGSSKCARSGDISQYVYSIQNGDPLLILAKTAPPDAEYQLHSVSAAGNPIFHSVSDPIPDEHLFNLGAIAYAVRNTVSKVDNYEFLRDCMSVCEQRYDEMNKKGHLPWMNPGPRAIGANLLHKYVRFRLLSRSS